MSRGQTLRALVNERLAAAAEDIFVLFERTIVEYEEELCRSKEENQRNVQIISSSPGPGLNQEITETVWIKEEPEEQSVKQEEEQLQVPVPESSAACVKTEDLSLLQKRQTEHREERQGDISSETHFHSETDHWEPFSWSAAQMDTETEGDDYNHIQFRDRSTELFHQYRSAPETSVHSGHMSGADGGHQNSVCDYSFSTDYGLQKRYRVHNGEKPYSCLICKKTFTERKNLEVHKRTHTGEKPYSCATCDKTFAQKCILDAHVRTHTGEKPYSCPACNKSFSQKCSLVVHVRTHTGEKPYACSICQKTFARKCHRDLHTRTHKL